MKNICTLLTLHLCLCTRKDMFSFVQIPSYETLCKCCFLPKAFPSPTLASKLLASLPAPCLSLVAVTKYHRLGHLEPTEIYFSHKFLTKIESGRLRSGCQHGQILVRTLVQVSPGVLTQWRESKPSGGPFYKGANAIHEGATS